MSGSHLSQVNTTHPKNTKNNDGSNSDTCTKMNSSCHVFPFPMQHIAALKARKTALSKLHDVMQARLLVSENIFVVNIENDSADLLLD